MKEAEELLEKYKAGLCTAEEVQLLQKWFHHLGEDEASELNVGDLTAAKLKFEQNIRGSILPLHKYKLWPRVAVTAAAVAAIVFGIWFFNSDTGALKQVQGDVVFKNDIAPGKNTATLLLANGKVIALDTNKKSVVVTDSVKTATMLTASTPRGGTYQVILPDGTKVWLNAASSIKFPSDFKGTKQRRIELTGEAYLEVAKDKSHPFIVESDGQQVEVLGTHFNVNSYADEGAIKTTLLEGSVKVNDVILKPNQQSLLTGPNRIQVKDVDVTEAVAWKNGLFSFNKAPMQTVMRQIARWYNVEVEYESDDLKNKLLEGSVSRYDKVSGILNAIAQTGAAKFKIEGKKIIVIK
ncbi:FecR family protein [Pedobacter frigoris]|uniref:DUF4974 domain-containing protein n=1 Tax=Pedobacter frigoris TaxID=2571272 RepID=A0A4U1CPC8_9SPHI|nr:FecR family protein [Pedobacter frigoris]TKC08615.1 DUF4974 domain-containing protein [Pedobacter frigoris]